MDCMKTYENVPKESRPKVYPFVLYNIILNHQMILKHLLL